MFDEVMLNAIGSLYGSFAKTHTHVKQMFMFFFLSGPDLKRNFREII